MTLLELLLVVVLIGIVASIIMPRIYIPKEMAIERTCYHNRSEINRAIERYGLVNGDYPSSLGDLDSTYFPEGLPVCPVTGDPYSLNTTTNRVEGHTNSSNH